MSSPSQNKCGKCKTYLLKNPKNKGDQSIMCDCCNLYYHIRCVGVSDEKLKILDDDDLHWYCPICNIASGKLKDQVTVLQANYLEIKTQIETINAKQTAQDEEITDIKSDLKSKFDNLQAQIEELKKPEFNTPTKQISQEGNSSSPLDVPKIKSIITNEINVLKRDEEELKLQEKKKNNLIFFKFPEEDFDTHDELMIDDFNKLKEACYPLDLKEKDISQLFRVGKKVTGKTRPILVTFKDEELRMKILKKSRNMEIKTEDGENIKVSVSTDKTPKQRETERKLREEIAERKAQGEVDLVIRNEKIVPFRPSAQKSWAMLFH